MARSSAVFAVLALVAVAMLVAPAAALTVTSSKVVSTTTPGSLAITSTVNGTTGNALTYIAAAADTYIAASTTLAASVADGVNCIANGTTKVDNYANFLWAAAATAGLQNVTATLTAAQTTLLTNAFAATAVLQVNQLCPVLYSAFVTTFSQIISFSAFNAATDTGFTTAEKNGASAIKFAVYSVASGLTITSVTDANYATALLTVSDISSKTSATLTTYRRRLLAVADTYTTTVYASNQAAATKVQTATSTGAWNAAVKSAISTLGYSSSMTAQASGASSLSVSLMTLGAALLVLLFGF